MFKVTAIWDGEVKEEVFCTKMSADEFAFRLMANDISSCPIVTEVKDDSND